MLRRLAIYVLIFFTVFSIFPGRIYANNLENLEKVVTENLGATDVSVSLRLADTGELIYALNGDTKRKPASNLKLLTGAAALSVLGERYRYKTELYIDGLLINDSLFGNVYLKGSGDPTLQWADLVTFAHTLKKRGIERIYGDIYGDDTYFTGAELTPGIKEIDETEYFASRTSALVLSPNEDFDAATIIVEVTPTEIGKSGLYSVTPNLSGMNITNRTKTVKGDDANTLEVKRIFRTDEIVLTGNIPIGSPMKEWVTVHDPTINTLHAMKAALVEQGIQLHKDSILARKEIPRYATHLYTKQSQTLKEMFPVFMKLSNNSMADIFVKTLGAEVYSNGETNTGLKVLRDYGEILGLSMNDWLFEDGSGMSHKNRVTANSLTLLLYSIQSSSMYNTFYTSLPVGGQEDRLMGGTLRNRFKEASVQNRVIAKTGNIQGVYTLSGYVTTAANHRYIFSIMTENQSQGAIKKMDDIVKTIIKHY